MNKPKLRILMNGEASYTLSGFGLYSREILQRLYDTGKYELAELASFGMIDHPSTKTIPWKYYANAVNPGDPRHKSYTSNPQFSFGKWRFEKTLLHFKPDVTINIRDTWMLDYEIRSPLKPFVHTVWMPTVDSCPQQEQWISDFIEADGVFTYTEWAQQMLHKESGGKINLCGTAPPGVDLKLFHPIGDIKSHRQKMGLPADINLLGTVMRNQKRKLFPDLFLAFRKFLDLCKKRGNAELAKKTFLYVHTSFPDLGWPLPLLLKETGISHKVIFTYICRNCKKYFAALFQDAKTVCPHCRAVSAIMPSVATGLSYEDMAKMMQMFDGYIQYATCGGIEIPLLEAMATGLPIMAVDYSGMTDPLNFSKGIPLKVQRMFRELETGALRALPDNDYTAEQMYKLFSLPVTMRKTMGQKARKAAEKHYNWDNIAKTWETYLDNIQLTGLQGKWNTLSRLLNNNIPTPTEQQLNNTQFIEWLFNTVLQRPDKQHSFEAMQLLRSVNYGAEIHGQKITKLTRKDIIKRFINRINEHNYFEELRCDLKPFPTEDYLEYADKLSVLHSEGC